MLRSLLVGFLSTPSARRATHTTTKQEDKNHISIHALREEGDDGIFFISLFNIIFLSTPSARRATPQAVRGHGGHQISIHALREEGDDAIGERQDVKRLISIHALREEGD